MRGVPDVSVSTHMHSCANLHAGWQGQGLNLFYTIALEIDSITARR